MVGFNVRSEQPREHHVLWFLIFLENNATEMKIHKIIKAIEASCVNITLHARKEAKDDSLRLDDIFFQPVMVKSLKITLMIFHVRAA